MTETNPQLELAYDFLESTGTSVFLTGKAGTGKTTFLRELKKRSPKRMIVVAPTGVAAINAGGVPIHSFFQLPFGPYIPGAIERDGGEGKRFVHRFGKEKINIIRSMDLLVIDESRFVGRGQRHAAQVQGQGKAVRRSAIVTDRRLAAIGAGGEGRGVGIAERNVRFPFFLCQPGVEGSPLREHRVVEGVSSVRRSLYTAVE